MASDRQISPFVFAHLQHHLLPGTQALEDAACLKVHDLPPGPDVELLLPGYRRLIPVLMSSGEWGQTLRAFWHLWHARLRPRASVPRPWNGHESRKPPTH